MTRDGFGREALAQPLASPGATAEHRLRDWSARTRSTAVQALRYSRFVGVMKRTLPIGAAAILAVVIAYSVVPRRQDGFSLINQRMGTLRNDLAMTKPRLTGTDARGNPFVITAAAAVQDPANRHRATLKQVEADMQFDGLHWLNASADTGLFDMDTGTLKLNGGIALYTDSGYELHTQSADVDLKKNIFQGADRVTGHGPLGSLSADRFHIDRLKRHMKLNGHVHMIMYPNKAKR
jgi:lipopolysaccharide export system protein LptC